MHFTLELGYLIPEGTRWGSSFGNLGQMFFFRIGLWGISRTSQSQPHPKPQWLRKTWNDHRFDTYTLSPKHESVESLGLCRDVSPTRSAKQLEFFFGGTQVFGLQPSPWRMLSYGIIASQSLTWFTWKWYWIFFELPKLEMNLFLGELC